MQQATVRKIINGFKRIFIRFPFPVIISISATFISILWIDTEFLGKDRTEFFAKLLSPLYIGFPLMISIALFAERRKFKMTYSLILQVMGSAFLLFLYFSFPTHLYNVFYRKIILLVLAFLTLVSFIASSGREKNHFFLSFNIRIFLQLITGAIYSGVLYAGLALALVATENLFDIRIPGEYYAYLSVIIMGLLYSLFILSGIPEINDGLKQDFHYPKVLKIFVQYILIPIVLVYLVILYAYGTKILILWSLPKGWVAYLISSFAILGIFSFLLVYPVHRQNPFLHRYYQFFFPLLLPLLLLLFSGIYVRIGDYGITENRYLLIVLFLWLSGISIYMIFNKLQNIILIPASIFVILLIISFGPWGISQVSLNSQKHRLIDLLQKNECLKNGKYSRSQKEISFDDKKQISSIVSYLFQDFGYGTLQPLFTEDLDSLNTENRNFSARYMLNTMMGLPFISEYAEEESSAAKQVISFDLNNTYFETRILPISSYDYYFELRIQPAWDGNKKSEMIAVNDTLMLTYHTDFHSNIIHFRLNDKPLFDCKLNPLINSITNYQTSRYEDYSLTETQSQKTFSSPDMDALIIIEHIHGELDKSNENPKINLRSISAKILFRIKAAN